MTTHSQIASVSLASARPNDVVLSPDGTRLYAAGSDGTLRVYDVVTGQLIASWAVGTKLGGMDISQDGSFIVMTEQEPVGVVADGHIVAVYRVDTTSGAVATFTNFVRAYEYVYFDAAILADGKVLLTQEVFPGYSAWAVPEILDLQTGRFTSTQWDVRQDTVITRSRDGSRVLLGEANISDARMLVYDPKEGVVSRQEWYEYNVSGFNSGRQAYSLEAGTAVQILGSNVHVYDALLTYRFDLAALHSRWAYGGLEMAAFDETGRLYVIDSIADEIVEISPATGAILRTIALGFDLQPAPEHLGNHLLVGPGSRYFTVITSNGLRLVANPHETGLVVGSDAGDTLSGTALPDTLEGRGGDDSLAGGAGVDTLRGEGGNDTLDGGLGSDTMIGGVGNDIYILESLDDAIVEFEGEGTDEVRTALGSRTDPAQMYTLAANVENLTGTSTTGQGVFANDLNNVVTMGAGGDLVVLDAGGNDLVSGGGGDDYLYWGAAFTSADKADGGLGFDTVGLLGNYALTFDGDDLVSVEKLAVYSSGNAATPNSYSLTMHDGNVAVGQKMMVVAQSLAAGEALTFNGAAETDGSFNVRGGRGADTITGGAKADTIWGGLGADTLRGGAGGDVFEYGSTTESKSAGADVIMDFEKGDKINLTGIDADGDAANGDSKFTWLGAGAFTGHAGELRVSQHPQYAQTWVVQADTNGDKQADLTIYLVAPAGFLPEKGDFYV